LRAYSEKNLKNRKALISGFKMESKKHIFYMLFMVVGEFLILLAAILASEIFHDIKNIPYLIFIFLILAFGVFFKYLAEKCVKGEPLFFER
jgi:high-affinity K+ transport system ATPase subunit B